MTANRPTPPTAVDRFWERFIARARKDGVKDSAVRWYVHHAERYLKAVSGKRPAGHSPQDVTEYLEGVGRQGRIPDWQFAQIVDAVRILLRTARAAVANEVDWGWWRHSAQSLEAQHPTIALEVASGSEPSTASVSGARGKEKRKPPSALDQVLAQHPPPTLLERLVAEIRRRRSSIRTELAYESWVCRFILFSAAIAIRRGSLRCRSCSGTPMSRRR